MLCLFCELVISVKELRGHAAWQSHKFKSRQYSKWNSETDIQRVEGSSSKWAVFFDDKIARLSP